MGTVRTNAQKCLGDAIIAGGLSVDTNLSYSDAHHNIFVTSGTNDLYGRLAQAKLVQAEARDAAVMQAKTEEYLEQRSLAQRLCDMEKISLSSTNENSSVSTASTTAVPITGGNKGNFDRTSHQIDLTRNYRLSSNQVAGENMQYDRKVKSEGDVNGDNASSKAPENLKSTKSLTTITSSPLFLRGDGTSRTLSYGDRCIDSESSGMYRPSHQAVLTCLTEGCEDSKLSVRVQAAWAMGNLLVLFIPSRKVANEISIKQEILFATLTSQ